MLDIDSDGNVTLKKTGTAQIKATVPADDTYAERSIHLAVTVDCHDAWDGTGDLEYAGRPPFYGLDLDVSDGPQQLVVPLRPGARVTRYFSTNPNVVYVDENGIVTPIAAGSASIGADIDDGGGDNNHNSQRLC